MEKQVIRSEVKYDFDWSDTTPQKIREDLDKLEAAGCNEIEISYHHGYECIEFECFSVHEETDQEQAERLRIEQERAERQKERDLKQYEIIKSKYNL